MNVKELWVADKYAQAFFQLYGTKLEERDFWSLRKAVMFLGKSPTALSYLALGKAYERREINQIFLTNFKLHANFLSLLELLQKQKRIFLLPEILTKVSEIFLARHGKQFFVFESYPSLRPEQAERAAVFLRKLTGVDLLYECYERPELIAGLRLRSTQFLYDDTISGKLQKCRRKLLG